MGTINNGWLQKPLSELHCAVSFVSSWRSSSSAARRVYRRQRPAPFPSRVVKSRHQSQLGVDRRDVTHAGSIGPHTAGSTSPRPGGLSLDDRVVFVTDSVRMSG